MGGQIQTRLVLDDEQKKRANKIGIKDIKKKYNIEDMIKGDVMFFASAITNGEIVDGIKDLGNKYEVSTFALHKELKIFKKSKKLSFKIMNDLSISGKQWIYKKFDNSYVNFLKENYFLDEITAKLLSIRNIEKKYINSFLKPSIKNLDT